MALIIVIEMDTSISTSTSTVGHWVLVVEARRETSNSARAVRG